MCNSVMNTFYFYFLTNVVMMSPGFMAIVTTVSRFAGVFYAPIKGVVLGKAEWKAGKYGMYLKWFEPISRILMVLCFVNIQANQTVQFIYYVGIFVIASFFSTFVDTAALASLPFITQDNQQRVRLSSKRSVVATIGQVLYSLITVKLVASLGNGDQGKGYLMVYIIYSIVAIVGYNITAQVCIKDYDFYKVSGSAAANVAETKQPVKEKENIPAKIYINAYLKNPAPVVLFLGDACKASASLVYGGAATYYLTYYVKNINALTMFLFVANMGLLVGSWCCPLSVKLVGRKWTNVLAYGGFGVCLILGHFIGVGTAWGITAAVGAGRFFSGLNASIIGAMNVDIADDYEYKTGYSLTPFFMSMGGLGWTLASVVTGGIVGGTLAKVGFDAAKEVTQPMLDAMLNLMTFIPGIPLAIGTVLFIVGYNLTDKHMDMVRAELEKRRAAKAAEKAEE